MFVVVQADLLYILDLAQLFADDDASKQVLSDPVFTELAKSDPEIEHRVQIVRLFQAKDYQKIIDVIGDRSELSAYDVASLGRGHHAMNNSVKALEILECALDDKATSGALGYLSILWRHSRILIHLARYSDALKELSTCEHIADQIQSPEISSLIMKDLATIAVNTGDPVKAIVFAERSLACLQSTDVNSTRYVNRKINLASLYVSAGRLSDALIEYEELASHPLVLVSSEPSLVTHLNLAITLKRLGRNSDSLSTYRRVLEIAELSNEPEFIVRALIGIADHFVIVADLRNAKHYINKAIEKVSEYDLRSMQEVVNIHLANVEHALGDRESAIHRLRSCYDQFVAEHNVRDSVLYGTDLAEWLAESGRFQEAFDILKNCSALQNSVYDQEIERTTQLSLLRSKLDVERESIRQRDEARTAILHSVLPAHIAQRLLLGERKIGERIESVTILFADVVGFTEMSATMQPERLVDLLEDLFTRMDNIAQAHGCERIKTIGDSYMAVCGLASSTPDHVEKVCNTALAFLAANSGLPLAPSQLRIGIHTGPIVAGVMSGAKLSYDIWGDTVNVASRMENHSSPGRILCTADVAHAVIHCAQFHLEKREPLDIRGKGLMTTYWLDSATV